MTGSQDRESIMGKLNIKRPETTVKLCLDMSLRADWERLDEQLREARKATTGDRLAGNTEANRLAEEIRELEQQMQAETVTFRLRAIPRTEWGALIAEHPAGDSEEDKKIGFNRATFFDALLARVDDPEAKPPTTATIREVTRHDGEPVEFDPAADWVPLADEMTDQQYSEIATAAFMLNRGKVSVPFSLVASKMTQDSDEI